jgi:di/tricarboxylate transporter
VPTALSALAVFVAVFGVATLRNIHLGVLMLPAACAVGVLLAGIPLKEVIAGFPVGIMVLLIGVTYLFGIAQCNGTIDRLIGTLLRHVGGRRAMLPTVVFLLTAGVSAMGSPQGGYVVIPVAMAIARRSGIDPLVMGVAINSGIAGGGMAPTSLFGIVTIGAARQAGIDLNPLTLLGVAMAANLVLLLAASWMFAGSTTHGEDASLPASPAAVELGLTTAHYVTLACIAGLAIAVITSVLAGVEPDIGLIALSFGALLAIIYPRVGEDAIKRIDWSTVFTVGGIITFVGVLQRLGAVDLLGRSAVDAGSPIIAALVVCMIAALVSAFASTTGILAALVPLAVPLATTGGVAGWALIAAMGVCASIVDVSPYSTTGALLVASAHESERPRLKSLLMRWGMSLVLAGPLAAAALMLLADV